MRPAVEVVHIVVPHGGPVAEELLAVHADGLMVQALLHGVQLWWWWGGGKVEVVTLTYARYHRHTHNDTGKMQDMGD